MWSILNRLLHSTPQFLTAIILLGTVWGSHTQIASAEAVSSTCDSLTAAPSSNTDTYSLTVTASNGSTKITGYTFNFGDQQSYTFALPASSGGDQHTATVSHTYPNAGAFTAIAHVDTKVDGKQISVSSPGCHTEITTGPAALVNTGAGDTLELFAATTLVGLICHQIWIRCRRWS
jgi:hypothetical protein